MNTIVILGKAVGLHERDKTRLRGISVGDSLSYRFYDGDFHGIPLLFAEPKGIAASPRKLEITAGKWSSLFQLPVVFLLPPCPAYVRQRLIDRDVFFVISDKFAHLPMLVANERIRKSRSAKAITPVAQYILLYHLQVENLEGKAARDLEGKFPYSYASITLGITCLADLGLCEKVSDGPRRKIIHFGKTGKDLWEQAQAVLVSPVERTVFCDGLLSDETFPTCGINALACYTRINPDPERIVMMSATQFRNLSASDALVQPNDLEGEIVIEVWRHPVVTKMGEQPRWVDRLSLALSLRDDGDPRVENEVERLIGETVWKG